MQPETESGLSGAWQVRQAYHQQRDLRIQKDRSDKHHWLLDEEAAAIVRRIFRLSIEGHGGYEIAKILREEQVECPSYYMAAKGYGRWKKALEKAEPYNWYGNTVCTILSKPEYMGHTVNFRSHKESYKDKRAVRHPPEDWLVFENTHEAIVDPETWRLAQQVKRTVRRTDTTGEANPLTGLVFCADCGAKMYNHRGGRKKYPDKGPDPATGLYPADSYDCSTYTLTFQNMTNKCFFSSYQHKGAAGLDTGNHPHGEPLCNLQ